MNVHRPGVARTDALLLLAITAVVASIAMAGIASRSGTLDDRARTIESQLRCPTCQGISIADSPASSAADMRVLVRGQLAAGASDDAVRAFFVARYGRWILLDPPASGPDLALWLAPAVIVAVGSLVVVRRAHASTVGTTRSWHHIGPVPASRLSTILVAAAMVFALAVPIAVVVGPRLAGTELSGRSVPQAAPSIEQLEAFVEADPGDVAALVALGDALLAANRAGEAADRYMAALKLDPDNFGALLGVGPSLLPADRADAAGPVFDRILALSPDQPDALLYRAVARLRIDGGVSDRVRGDVDRFLDAASPDDPRRAMAAGLLEEPAAPSPDVSAPRASRSPPP